MGGFFISNFCDNQLWLCTLLISCCLSSAKIQNFKAIHNSIAHFIKKVCWTDLAKDSSNRQFFQSL